LKGSFTRELFYALPQSHARAAAILGDEIDSGMLRYEGLFCSLVKTSLFNGLFRLTCRVAEMMTRA
jgi:hypothetical protein